MEVDHSIHENQLKSYNFLEK